MKKWIAGVAVVASGLAVAGTAGAEPRPKNVETYLCDGVETTIVIAGRNGWIDGERWQAVEFSVTGTVTPADGSAPFPVLDEKVWGQGATGAAEEVTCVQAINESDPAEGTFVGQVTVIIRPG